MLKFCNFGIFRHSLIFSFSDAPGNTKNAENDKNEDPLPVSKSRNMENAKWQKLPKMPKMKFVAKMQNGNAET